MKRLLPLLLLSLPALGQSLSVYPTAPHIVAGVPQVVTAYVSGVNDKTVTWTAPDGGTIQGTNPCVINEPCTASLTASTPGTYRFIATSNANGAVTATSTITVTAAATLETGHPRFGINSSTLAAMQAKATGTFYTNGPRAQAITLFNTDNLQWNWSCGGGPSNTKTGLPVVEQSQTGYGEVYNAYFYAFMDLIDHSDPTYNWACYAKDTFSYTQQYVLGPLNNGLYSTQPYYVYRQVDWNYGTTGNSGADFAEMLTFTADWAMHNGEMGSGTGSGATFTAGTVSKATFTANATAFTNTLTGVTVTSGTPTVGMAISCTGAATAGIPAGFVITGISGSTYTLSDNDFPTDTMTCTAGTISGVSVSAGGTGYNPSSTIFWYATGGTNCVTSYQYANGQGGLTAGNGVPVTMSGYAFTNSSGVITSATVSTVPIGCTAAPTNFVIKDTLQSTHDFLAIMGQQNIFIGYTGVRANPSGAYNSSAQYDTGNLYDFGGQRGMGNNYSHAKELQLMATAFTFNDNTSDDPPLTGVFNSCGATRYQVCPDGTAGSLHAYANYLFGGMIYKDWAHIEDPNVSWQAYQTAYANLPSQPKCHDSVGGTSTSPLVPCFGDGRDGESSEGNWYQYSMYRSAAMCDALQTAGLLNPTLTNYSNGPQVAAYCSSSWWDMKANMDLALLTYYYLPSSTRWTYFGDGDMISGNRGMNDFATASWMLAYDHAIGRSDRDAKWLWPALNMSTGGLGNYYTNLQGNGGYLQIIPLYLALPSGDPTASPPADPRPSLPTDYFSGNNGHLLVRSGWVANGPESPNDTGSTPATQTAVNLWCQASYINHQFNECGAIDVLSNGEYITKRAWTGGDYNGAFEMAENSNILGVGVTPAFPCATAGSCFLWNFALGMAGYSPSAPQIYPNGTLLNYGGTNYTCIGSPCAAADVPGSSGNWSATGTPWGGGQFAQGYQAGNATIAHSEMPNYVAYQVNDPGLYNGSAVTGQNWGALTGVTAASRTVIFLRSAKTLAYYDRSASNYQVNNWFNTTGPVTITGGNVAKWTTRSGTQDAYLSTLGPSTATMVDFGQFNTCTTWVNGSCTASSGSVEADDNERYTHIRENAGSVSTYNDVHVLQWGAHSFTRAATSLVQSISGNPYDGSLIGTTLVMFMHTWPATFSSTTFAASGATSIYVADLTPNTLYSVTGAGAPSSVTTDDAGVAVFSAAGTGNIVLGAGGAPAAPTNLRGVVIQGVQVQ